jgi:hypothetical protein
MNKTVAAASLLFLAPALALAQGTTQPPRGQGYVFVGAATRGMSPNVGFGGEVYDNSGLGAGLEIGTAALTIPITGNSNKVLGLGSADLSYHFFPKKPDSQVAPFVIGGYTLFF